MTTLQLFLTVLITAVVTLLTRMIAFLAFPSEKKAPPFILWMGRQLPRAVMAMLVIYCLKDISFFVHPWGIPALLGVLCTAGLHLWKKNTVLSVCGGTFIYMLLLRLI